MSYPKTLGELWDMGPKTAEAWEQAECWEREFYALTQSSRYQSERSPDKIRDMVQEILDAYQADY